MKMMAAVGAWVGSTQVMTLILAIALAGGVLALVSMVFNINAIQTVRNTMRLIAYRFTSGLQPHPEMNVQIARLAASSLRGSDCGGNSVLRRLMQSGGGDLRTRNASCYRIFDGGRPGRSVHVAGVQAHARHHGPTAHGDKSWPRPTICPPGVALSEKDVDTGGLAQRYVLSPGPLPKSRMSSDILDSFARRQRTHLPERSRSGRIRRRPGDENSARDAGDGDTHQ